METRGGLDRGAGQVCPPVRPRGLRAGPGLLRCFVPASVFLPKFERISLLPLCSPVSSSIKWR